MHTKLPILDIFFIIWTFIHINIYVCMFVMALFYDDICYENKPSERHHINGKKEKVWNLTILI